MTWHWMKRLYLHHKDPSKILNIEVDASDVGWGACAYQRRNPFEEDPKDEARMRVGDTGPLIELTQLRLFVRQIFIEKARMMWK